MGNDQCTIDQLMLKFTDRYSENHCFNVRVSEHYKTYSKFRYNPNIIRSSVGGVFTVPIAMGSSEKVIDFLKKQNISIYAATLQDSVVYDTIDFKKATALVVGTESTGLSELWRKAATTKIRIPMQGKIDSMNVSVAAGILVFEAKRQRKFS